MDGDVKIADLMAEFHKQGFVIIKEDMLHIASKEAKRKDLFDALKNSNWLTCSEISKAGIWGNIGAKAVYNYAKNHCKEGELLENEDKRKPLKIINTAVKRIAFVKGIVWK